MGNDGIEDYNRGIASEDTKGDDKYKQAVVFAFKSIVYQTINILVSYFIIYVTGVKSSIDFIWIVFYANILAALVIYICAIVQNMLTD